MNQLSEKIMQFAGKEVQITIEHKIYGRQKIKVREFRPIYDTQRVGFYSSSQEIYIDSGSLVSWEYNYPTLRIIGKLTEFLIEMCK